MRGATAPRLILELIAARTVIVEGDTSDQGLLARIERLERQSNMAPIPSPSISEESKPKKEEKKVPSKIPSEPKLAEAIVESAKVSQRPSGTADITLLRRMWPDVIENVKKRRRLTWSLLSASAQILATDENSITIGIVNSGARDS